MYRLRRREYSTQFPLSLIPFYLLSHPFTLLYCWMFLPRFALFSRHPSYCILFCFFLSFSLSFTSVDAIQENQEIRHYRMPPLDSTSAQTKGSHVGTKSYTSAAETAFKSPVITESLSKSIYCKRLETGTISIQPRFWEVNFNFSLTTYPET
jgi:hypothetical protein